MTCRPALKEKLTISPSPWGPVDTSDSQPPVADQKFPDAAQQRRRYTGHVLSVAPEAKIPTCSCGVLPYFRLWACNGRDKASDESKMLPRTSSGGQTAKIVQVTHGRLDGRQPTAIRNFTSTSDERYVKLPVRRTSIVIEAVVKALNDHRLKRPILWQAIGRSPVLG